MTSRNYAAKFRRLVEEYNQRRLTTAEYRLRRQQILSEVDAYYNGAGADDLTTQPNFRNRKTDR